MAEQCSDMVFMLQAHCKKVPTGHAEDPAKPSRNQQDEQADKEGMKATPDTCWQQLVGTLGK